MMSLLPMTFQSRTYCTESRKLTLSRIIRNISKDQAFLSSRKTKMVCRFILSGESRKEQQRQLFW